MNVKRNKTVNSFKKNNLVLDSLHTSNFEKESVVNITINSHMKNKRNNSRSRKRPQYRRHKTELCEYKKASLNELITRIITKHVSNVNINININEIKKRNSLSAEKKNPIHLWKKALNVQRMVNAFLHPSVVKISDNEIFDESLRNTLLGSSIKSTNKEAEQSKAISMAQFLQKSEVEKEFIRVSLKEKAFQLITEGASKDLDILSQFEKLFQQNPEKLRYSPYEEKYLFNQPLSNGKTLLYIACQEGTEEIVEYLLSKKLNPNIRVHYYDMEDTCLWVASRWGYYEIVKMLLETKKIPPDDIDKALEEEYKVNKKISKLLFSYLPDEYKKKRKGCACF